MKTTMTCFTIGLAVTFALVALPGPAPAQEPAAPAADETVQPVETIGAPVETVAEPAPEVMAPVEAALLDAAPTEPPAEDPAGMETGGEPETAEEPGEEPEIEFIPSTGLDIEPVLTQSGEDLISITLDNVPLEDVIRMFTRISGANIIATKTDLEGASVTVNLTDVAWQPALSAILDMHNLALVEKRPGSKVYSIIPKQPDAPEPTVVETIFLKYTTTGDVSPVIKSMASGGIVTEFSSRNVLVVRATASNMGEIEQLIEKIDIPSKQVVVETKFMELNDEAAEQIGIRWDSLEEFGASLQVGPFERTEVVSRDKERKNTLDRWDLRSRVDTRTDRYDLYGQAYQEVEDTFENPTAITPTREVIDIVDQGEDITKSVIDTFNKAIEEKQAAILELDSFQVLLSALKKTEGISVVSNPKMIVANGAQDAFFSVGEREPIIKTEITRGTAESPGDKEVASLDTSIDTEYIKEGYLETGIILKVVPIVKTDDLIEAQITPTIRRKIADKTVAGNTWPVIAVKEIRTKFTLRSGQTVAVGGLIDTADDVRISKIPLLGDIPLIGKYLFSHKKDVKSQVETIIFVTLSLAQPNELRTGDGLPENAKLVHKQMIRDKTDRAEFEADLEALREAAGLEEEAEAEAVATPDAGMEPEAGAEPDTEPAAADEVEPGTTPQPAEDTQPAETPEG